MKNETFTVVVYKEEEMYVAECWEIGTVDQGQTIEEAIGNLREATRLYLEESSLPDNISPKFITTMEVSYA